jgi:hypothetical protein
MTSHPFINRHPPPKQARQPLTRPRPRPSPRPYIMCSPEGCAVIKNPKHAPQQPTTYLTPDYSSDSDDYDCYDHLENSHAM